MACTGIEFCKLAIVETKARARTVMEELENRLPEFDQPITINVNGCPNSCARIQIADIGLKGLVMTDDAGERSRATRSTSAAASARPPAGPQDPRGCALPPRSCPTTSSGSAAASTSSAPSDERFAAWAQRADEEDLR